jgi:hypothetical protein
MKRKVLVVDIGGTHVKLLMSSRDQREFGSGPRMKPGQMSVGKPKTFAPIKMLRALATPRIDIHAREGTRTPKDFSTRS